MPNYNVPQAGGVLTALQPGDGPYYLFNAESPTAPQASVAFARGYSPTGNMALTFQVVDATTAVVQIQGSNLDVAADYVVLHTSNMASGTPLDSYTDLNGFAFYRAYLVSGTGPLTVVVV